ncbi:MAG: hypothetical protein ACR2O6_04125 [Ilumatobacteraceae bacterium]
MTAGPVGAITAAVPGLDLFAPGHSGGSLAFTIVLILLAAGVLGYTEYRVMPTRPGPAPRAGALRRDSPAVVNVLTNDCTLTAAGLRATVIDLGARGWLRILPPDEDDELARVRPSATAFDGDSLLPHERLVLQHVMARFTTDRAIPVRFLAVDVNGSWWRRFRSLVNSTAMRDGLVKRRWTPLNLLPASVLTVLAALSWRNSRTGGTDVAVIDSIERRMIAVVTLLAIVALGVRIVQHLARPKLTHTEAGLAATERWLAVRERLVRNGFGPMAPSALETGDRRLGYASAMCLAEGAAVELPLAREDARRAWSSVKGKARLVRVSYPSRVGYGLHPLTALVIGIAFVFAGLWGKRWFTDVARGEALDSLYERFPEQDWLIADIATGLAVLSFVPLLIGLWMAFAGAADMFNTIERTGMVLRARRPVEVTPLPRSVRRFFERDRYSVFVAVDDGSKSRLVAWRSNERNAIPQGARATVRATPLLGYVRKSTPVGHVLPD